MARLSKGVNVTILVVGQSGSGKSFVTYGEPEKSGIIPRALADSLKEMKARKAKDKKLTCRVTLSMVEVYMEETLDLLSPFAFEHVAPAIRVNEELGPWVEGMKRCEVTTDEEIDTLLMLAKANRAAKVLNTNASPRFATVISQIQLTQQRGSRERIGTLTIIETPAGEEDEHTGDHMTDSSVLTQATRALDAVILAESINTARRKTEGDEAVDDEVDYAASAVTKLLEPHMANDLLFMIATISPDPEDYTATLQTLRLAERFRRISSHTPACPDSKTLLKITQAEMKRLQTGIADVEALDGPRMPSKQFATPEALRKQKQQLAELRKKKLEWVNDLAALQRLSERLEMTASEKVQESKMVIATCSAALNQNGYFFELDPNKRMEKLMSTSHIVFQHVDPQLDNQIIIMVSEDVAIGHPNSTLWQPPDVTMQGVGMGTEVGVVGINAKSKAMVFTPEPQTIIHHNGTATQDAVPLAHNDRLVIGPSKLFRVMVPKHYYTIVVKNRERRAKRAKRQAAREARGLPPEEHKHDIVDPPLTSAMDTVRELHIHTVADLMVEVNIAKKEVEVRAAAMEAKIKGMEQQAEEYSKESVAVDEEAVEVETELQAVTMERNELQRAYREEKKKRKKEKSARRAKPMDAEEKEAAEKAKAETKAKLAELGEKIDALKARDHAAMKAKAQLLRDKSEATLTELKEVKANAESLWRERKTFRALNRAVLDRLSLLQVDISEANIVADEWERDVSFEIQLWSGGKYNLAVEPWLCLNSLDALRRPPATWHVQKFLHRMAFLRKEYLNFLNCSRQVSLVPHNDDNDPLYDGLPYKLIGKATLFLDGLSYIIEVEESLPIVDRKGTAVGELILRLSPFQGEKPPEPGVDNEIKEDRIDFLLGETIGIALYIRNAVGLSVPNVADVYCQFSFLDEDQRQFVTTPPCPYFTHRPRFEFLKIFKATVTEELCDYFRESRLEVKVFGAAPSTQASKRPLLRGDTRPRGHLHGTGITKKLALTVQGKEVESGIMDADLIIEKEIQAEQHGRDAIEVTHEALQEYAEELERRHIVLGSEHERLQKSVRTLEEQSKAKAAQSAAELLAERRQLQAVKEEVAALEKAKNEAEQRAKAAESKICIIL